MSRPSAQIIADSVSPAGDRLTTIEVKLHRFVLPELLTHRAFSRNSGSSRARPLKSVIDEVRRDPAMPVFWGKNESGMQARHQLGAIDTIKAMNIWRAAMADALERAEALGELGLHKQLANRLIEPYSWQRVIVSSTEWQNFFEQRSSHFSDLAQPEIAAAADAMFEAYNLSTPVELQKGEWHTPYVTAEDGVKGWEALKVSGARCARVSYLTHDGRRDIGEDVALFGRLRAAEPPHWSPMEHVATPGSNGLGNFQGWTQLRHCMDEVFS